MFLDKEQVNSLILKLGLITQEDFDIAKEESQERGLTINNILIRKGFISEDELREIQGKVSGVSFIDLKEKDVDEDVLLSIPEPVARKYNIIAFDRDRDTLKIAVLDLDILEEVDFLKKNVALKVIPYLTDQISINQNILKYQELLKKEYGSIIQKEFLGFQTISRDSLNELSREEFLEIARDKRINFVFELFLKHALLQKASNIHIEPQENKTLIKYRIGGKIYSAMVLPKNASLILDLKIRALAGISNNKKLNNLRVGFDGKEIVFQVNKIDSIWGERIVLNILFQGESGFSLESLGFHGRALDILYSEINKKEKTILITGGKNSGKSTTFYTLLDSLNDFNLAIGTVENSIGFYMNGVNQTMVNYNIGFGVSQAINKYEKQNLDILGVDRIEDSHDLKSLFKPLWVDRFNFAVLEFEEKSGAEIIFKLKNLEINPAIIAANLNIVISQKLITELVSGNKEEYYLSVAEIQKLSKRKDVDMEKVMDSLVEEGVLVNKKSWSEVPFFKSKNKKDQENDSKIMVSEVFKVSPTIKEMILNNSTKNELENQALKEGMMTLAEDTIFKAVQGLISIEEIL
ncbi:Flp pilus assembly complex ATPase component TadA [Patescibacteria group bacterium]|nr:Flp pilus assembly complex ATPase component TadA [Patescibacteria group bacterium]